MVHLVFCLRIGALGKKMDGTALASMLSCGQPLWDMES